MIMQLTYVICMKLDSTYYHLIHKQFMQLDIYTTDMNATM